MQAGGVYLSPTLQTLRRKQLLFPGRRREARRDRQQRRHSAGIRRDPPRRHRRHRCPSPPTSYAKYGLFYIKAALAGQTFKPGPTDHGSTIVQRAPGILEDQLPAPLVTKSNVDDKSLWGNTIK